MSKVRLISSSVSTVSNGKNTKIHRITWPSVAIPRKSYDAIANWVKKSRNYAPLSIGSKKALIAIKTKDVNLEQAISIRNAVVKDKIIKNYHRMNAQIASITAKYISGRDILKLAQEYDFPPLNLLRGIFLQMGLPVGNIYNIFSNKEDPSYLLTGRNLEQYWRADSHDAESIINQQYIAQIAVRNEFIMVDYIKSLGIAIKTQDELTAEQLITHGRAVLTPDILFIDEVYINDQRCHWIDYKDYVGCNVHFLYTSNEAQAAKYTAKWGPGAMCYGKSFVADLSINGAELLDGRALPIRYQK